MADFTSGLQWAETAVHTTSMQVAKTNIVDIVDISREAATRL